MNELDISEYKLNDSIEEPYQANKHIEKFTTLNTKNIELPAETEKKDERNNDNDKTASSYENSKFVLNQSLDIDISSELDVMIPEAKNKLSRLPVIVNSNSPFKTKVRYKPLNCMNGEDNNDIKEKDANPKDVKSEKSKSIVGKETYKSKDESTAIGQKKSIKSNIMSKKSEKSFDYGSPSSARLKDSENGKNTPRENNTPRSNLNNASRDDHSSLNNTEVNKSAAIKQKQEIDGISAPDLMKKMIEDLEPNKKPFIVWSGQDILSQNDDYLAQQTTGFLTGVRIWQKGIKGIYRKSRYVIKTILESQLIDAFLILCGLANTVILAMSRYEQPEREASIIQIMNNVFTGIFIAEMALKIFAIGIVKYVFDAMNIIDGVVVILSIVEIIFLDSSQNNSFLKSFQAFRILRAFRVIRMVRVLRALRSMRLLIQVIGEAITSFAYVGVLLILFMFIYSLLGMQLFGGKFPPSEEPDERQTYDSFQKAFLSVYQILTIENWQSIQYMSMREQVPILVAIFYVSWLFIGNYILLNLFLALMLDAFAEVENSENNESEVIKYII